MANTRFSHPEDFPLGTLVEEADKVIKGAKLPTYSAVIKCFLAHKEPGQKWEWNAAKKAVEQVKIHYDKSNVAKIEDNHCAEKIIKFWTSDIKGIKKIRIDRREKEPYKSTIEQFRKKLEITMPLGKRMP